MLKWAWTIFLLALSVFSVLHAEPGSQILSSLTKSSDCADLQMKALRLVVSALEAKNYQEIEQVTVFLDEQCGSTQLFFPVKALSTIALRRDMEWLDKPTTVYSMLFYQRTADKVKNEPVPEQLIGERALILNYVKLINVTAKDLLPNQSRDSESFLLALFFTQDFAEFYQCLWNGNYNDTGLYFQFSQYYKENRVNFGFCSQLYSGAWIPVDRMDPLGVHPVFGLSLGIKTDFVEISPVLEFQFLGTPGTYSVVVADEQYQTRHFFGGSFGLNLFIGPIGPPVIHGYVVCSLGYQGFDTLSKEVHDSISSGYLSAGVELRHIFFPSPGFTIDAPGAMYTFLRTLYTFTDYKNPGGTALDGNTVSVHIGIGMTYVNRFDRLLLQEIHRK